MLSILCVRRTIKEKVGIPESFKVGWYPLKKTGSSHLKAEKKCQKQTFLINPSDMQIVLVYSRGLSISAMSKSQTTYGN